jgi:hypothetical protein
MPRVRKLTPEEYVELLTLLLAVEYYCQSVVAEAETITKGKTMSEYHIANNVRKTKILLEELMYKQYNFKGAASGLRVFMGPENFFQRFKPE